MSRREAAEQVAGEAGANGIAAAAYGMDVRDADAVQKLAEDCWSRFGSVELLFNNAGVIAEMGPIWLTDPRDVEWVLGVNLVGVLNGLRAFVPRFIASGAPAWVVNTGSEHSLGLPHAMAGVYNATKHAVLGLSDMLRAELPENVGVSVLCPGLVESTMWKATERPAGRTGRRRCRPRGQCGRHVLRPARLGGGGKSHRGAGKRVLLYSDPSSCGRDSVRGAPRRSATPLPPRRRDTTATIAMTSTTCFAGSRPGSDGFHDAVEDAIVRLFKLARDGHDRSRASARG